VHGGEHKAVLLLRAGATYGLLEEKMPRAGTAEGMLEKTLRLMMAARPPGGQARPAARIGGVRSLGDALVATAEVAV